jgi:hypothetical protein
MFGSQSKRLQRKPLPMARLCLQAWQAPRKSSANLIVRKWRCSMSADTANITAEKVTAAVKSSATFNAPRNSRCGEDASVLRRDAEPPAARAAATRALAKPLRAPGALQRC